MGRSSALRLLSGLVTFALAVTCEKDRERERESIWGMTVAMSSHVRVSTTCAIPSELMMSLYHLVNRVVRGYHQLRMESHT